MCSAPPLRVSGIVTDSIVDGPGLRLAVFTQGCPHGCPGCHNPQSHDPAGGYPIPIADIVARVEKNPLLSGVTITGGEPMEQAGACLSLLEALPAGLSRWLYSGWTWEEIMASGDADRVALAAACHVLVDGRFRLEERSLELRFCGSRNQRLLDVPASLQAGAPVLWTPPEW